jgi:hypothetical protein
MIAIRVWFGPVVSRRTSLATSRENYEALVAKLIERVGATPVEKRAMRVLVDPINGLEDSSRYWSLNEVLEHLLIVSRAMEKVILSLCAGEIPPGIADTAKVKPRGSNLDTLEEFRGYAPGLLARIDEAVKAPGMNMNSPLRFRHPWFGPITARQWYWVMSTHIGLHYQQAKRIAAGLPA